MLHPKAVEAVVQQFKKGSIVRVGYKTELPVWEGYEACYGMRIVKYTERSFRIGPKYWNLDRVKQRKKNEPVTEVDKLKARVNNFEHIVDNILLYNTFTEKHYLQVTNLFNGKDHVKIQYDCYMDGPYGEGDFSIIQEGTDTPPQFMRVLVTDNYWNKQLRDMTDIKRINLDNVLYIGNKNIQIGQRIFK